MRENTEDLNTLALLVRGGVFLSAWALDILNDAICCACTNDPVVQSLLESESAQSALNAIAGRLTAPACREAVLAFLDFSTLDRRLGAADTDSVEYLNCRGRWCQGRLIVTARAAGRVSRVLWLVEEIDQEKRNRERLARENLTLAERNRCLARQVDDAEKIAALTEAVRSLMTHMPALTYTKDAATGAFLICNQKFADYALKPSPAEVMGLNAFDIFDASTARSCTESDRKALTMEEPYTFYEDVLDAAGQSRQLQTTKLKFTDGAGRLCVLGMSTDVTELTRMRRENQQIRDERLTFSRIARALSADYSFLYYVDLTTEDYTEFKADSALEELAEEHTGRHFFTESRENARRIIYPADQERFLASFCRENVLRTIRDHGAFNITYRLMLEGRPTYVYMKATQMDGDEGHLIIGVNNVDAQMRTQEAADRLRSERITFNRITALSGDYIVIYVVDPVTEAYTEYGASRAYENLHINRTGDRFFDSAHRDSETTIHPEDVHLFQTLLTRENVMGEIAQNGIFVMDYRLILEGKSTYVSLKAAMVEEQDGPQLIVGIVNTDAKVRREQEYARNLSVARELANRDELTGVKNKHAYVDAERALNMKLEEGEAAEFAIVVCDVNDLKLVNDTLGHNAGDRYIRKACAIVCRIFKHSPVYRVGGDEFAVICQGYDNDHIDALLEEVHWENAANREAGDIQIACGMARFAGDRNVEAVFERADHQMYAHKAQMKQKACHS